MDNLVIAWTAGIIEGEGSFSLTYPAKVVIKVQMTDKDVVKKLHDTFGGSFFFSKRKQDHHKDSWIWSLQGMSAVSLMYKILPYMGERRSLRINECISAFEAQKDKNQLVLENKKLAALDYISNGRVSLRGSANKYGVSYETVRKYVNQVS